MLLSRFALIFIPYWTTHAFSSTALAACRRGGRPSLCSVRLRATAENTPTPTPEPAAAWPGTPLEAAGQIALIALPSICVSLALPTLLAAARAAPGDTSALLAVLLGKRVALYAVAVCAVALVSLRSTGAAPGLGARVEAVTREGLRPFGARGRARRGGRGAAARGRAAARRDAARGAGHRAAARARRAAAALRGGALAARRGRRRREPEGGVRGGRAVSNFAVAALFVNAELQASALAVSGAAAEPDDGGEERSRRRPRRRRASRPRPSRPRSRCRARGRCATRSTCAAAVGVGRALQLPELAAVAGALVALAAYDVVGTSAPAGAAEVAASAMEGAARALVGGRRVGAGPARRRARRARLGRAGVGDVVFPAMLAGWARRRDVALADGGGGYPRARCSGTRAAASRSSSSAGRADPRSSSLSRPCYWGCSAAQPRVAS